VKNYMKKIFFIALSLVLFVSCFFSENNLVKAETNIIDNGAYRIKNVNSSLYLDIENGSNANGALTVQALGTENSSQIFKISKDTSLRYLITIEKNSKVIEVKGNTADEMYVIQQNDFFGKFNQAWDIRILSDDSVVFINYLTNGAIGIDNGDLNPGSYVKAQKYTGANNQKWRLEPVGKNSSNTGNGFINNEENTGIFNNANSIFSNLSLIQIIVGSIFIVLVLVLVIGQLLYGFRIKPRFLIKGKLYYKPLAREEEKFINYLDFKRKRNQKIIISFDHKFKKADFYVGDGSLEYQLIIEKISEMNLPHFLEGYRSFNKDRNPIKLRVSATEPGILNFGEFVYSKHFIVDGSKFDSGAIIFRYVENGK